MRRVVVSILLLASTSVSGQTITDGDTIKQGGITYRLWGIDAPEAKQRRRVRGLSRMPTVVFISGQRPVRREAFVVAVGRRPTVGPTMNMAHLVLEDRHW